MGAISHRSEGENTLWVICPGKTSVPCTDDTSEYCNLLGRAAWRYYHLLDSLPVGMRVVNAVVSYVRYLGKAFWPAGLAAYYPSRMWSLALMCGAGAVLASVSGGMIWRARRQPYLVTGWLWYLGTLVPVIGLVQAGAQSMADRYTYIPLVGLFIMVAWCLPHSLVEQRRAKDGCSYNCRGITCQLCGVDRVSGSSLEKQ